jgi:hypothetical protein
LQGRIENNRERETCTRWLYSTKIPAAATARGEKNQTYRTFRWCKTLRGMSFFEILNFFLLYVYM